MLRAVAREWLSWVYPFVCELCGRGGLPCLPGLPRKFRACRASLLCRLRGTGGGFLHPVRIMPPLRGVSPLF